MALQGDLSSFALPDVLRLLAGTGKSGRLEVSGPNGWGEVVLAQGTIASGAVERAPHATEAGDVVFELLRFDSGAFAFDELDGSDDRVGADVDEAIGAAEALLAEWTEVEAVVPSMEAWLALAPEVDEDGVHVGAEQWKALAAIGGGGTVRDLADALGSTDLATCRLVKGMIEDSMVSVRPSHAYTEPMREPHHGPTIELDSFEQYETDLAEPMTELEDLVVEDRPVVMEDREDALLPEPLPGEGVAFEGEHLEGSVDHHAFDTDEAPMALAEVGVGAPTDLDGDVAPFPSTPSAADEFDSETSAEGEPLDDVVDHEHPGIDGALDPAAEADAFTSALEAAGTDEPTGDDDERGSLLRFLSSVKP